MLCSQIDTGIWVTSARDVSPHARQHPALRMLVRASDTALRSLEVEAGRLQ